MKQLTRFITLGGVMVLLFVAWLASTQGWSLSTLSDPQALKESRKACPDYQKDKYGNCPPVSHRVRMGSRNFYGGGGK